MKKCPYCGYGNENKVNICEHCRAELPAEKPKEQSEKTGKKSDKE